MPFPSNSDDQGGFYSPDPINYQPLPNFQEFLNSTNGELSIQDKDALHNLISALPMLKSENLELAGERVMWLRRLTFGTRCSTFDVYHDQCGRSKCPECFNTGWHGGYSPAVELKMSFTPGRADILIEQAGLTVTQRPTAWTIITNPFMQEKDIVVTSNNERYEVHSAEAVELQGRRYTQNLTLSRIDRDDVKYYVPVPGYIGEMFKDFGANITIAPPATDFQATIFIKNNYWSE